MDMDAAEFYAIQRALKKNDGKHRGSHGQKSSRHEPSQQETRDVESTDTYHGQPTPDEATTNDAKESVGPFHNSTEQDNDNTVPGQIAPSAQDDPDPVPDPDPDSGADINDIFGPNIPSPPGSFKPLPSDTSATINNTYHYNPVQNVTYNHNDTNTTNTTNNNNDSHTSKPSYILSIRWIGWVLKYRWFGLSAVVLFLAISWSYGHITISDVLSFIWSIIAWIKCVFTDSSPSPEPAIIFAQPTQTPTVPSAVVPVLVHKPDAVIQSCRSFHRMVIEMPTFNDQVTQIKNAAAQGEIFTRQYFERVDLCQKGVAQILEAIHAESWKLGQTVLADPDTNPPLSLFQQLLVLLRMVPSPPTPQSILKERWISYHILLYQTLTELESLMSDYSDENMKPITEELENQSKQINKKMEPLLKKANTMPNEDQVYEVNAKNNLVFASYKNAKMRLHSLDSTLLPNYIKFLKTAVAETDSVIKDLDGNWVRKKEELSEALNEEREMRETSFRELCY